MKRRLEYKDSSGEWVPSLLKKPSDYPGVTMDDKVAYLNMLPIQTKYRLAPVEQTR